MYLSFNLHALNVKQWGDKVNQGCKGIKKEQSLMYRVLSSVKREKINRRYFYYCNEKSVHEAYGFIGQSSRTLWMIPAEWIYCGERRYKNDVISFFFFPGKQ